MKKQKSFFKNKNNHIRLYGGAGHRNTGNGQMALDAASACTACGQHPLLLGVDVHQNPALKVGKIHGRCTQPAHPLAAKDALAGGIRFQHH